MEDVKRWSVTYTKHIKQKRKIYQDGYLHLLSNKVMLYDVNDKLLGSMFLKKDKSVKSGETLEFDSYFVDVGDPECDHKPISSLNIQFRCKDNRTTEKVVLPHGEKSRNDLNTSDRKSNPGRTKVSAVNMSPSQKIIREFKKNEMLKYGTQKSPPSFTSSMVKEWQVLYTKQVTQKSKKFHDGTIRVVIYGSRGRQVDLYDASKNLLDRRFLKRDEVITSGESLAFEAYLVDIGDPEGNHEYLADLKIQGRNRSTTGEAGMLERRCSENSSFVEKRHGDACSGKNVDSKLCNLGIEKRKLRKMVSDNKSLRDVHEILSILRKSIVPESILITRDVPVKQCSESSDMVLLDIKVQDQFAGQLAHDSDAEHPTSSVAQLNKDEKAFDEEFTRMNSCESNIPDPLNNHDDFSCEIKPKVYWDDGGKLQSRNSASIDFCLGPLAADKSITVINTGPKEGTLDRPSSPTRLKIVDTVLSYSPGNTRPSTEPMPIAGMYTSVTLRESPELWSSKDYRENLFGGIDAGDCYQSCKESSDTNPSLGEKVTIPALRISGSEGCTSSGLGDAGRTSTAATMISMIKDDCPSFDLGF
ncbi:hypothetical protein Nepgr_011159 [Nepenthes gracilis]|uniref:5'-3' DNA helicase ZGRF1-like N-terminal domain-containing protein n=1 Tax=Nepenthes gracilis TaxID=150966 RepID=A0AAD3SDP1_NEPGR|nr:hypothetical protein Nepgr_011159 [Nepenthes gracilis]